MNHCSNIRERLGDHAVINIYFVQHKFTPRYPRDLPVDAGPSFFRMWQRILPLVCMWRYESVVVVNRLLRQGRFDRFMRFLLVWMRKLKRKFTKAEKKKRIMNRIQVMSRNKISYYMFSRVKSAWLKVSDKLIKNEVFARPNVARLTTNIKATNFFQRKQKGDCDEFVSKTRNFIAWGKVSFMFVSRFWLSHGLSCKWLFTLRKINHLI